MTSKTLGRHGKELESHLKVKSIAIFRSFIKGMQNEGSDIDLLVEFSAPVSLLHIIALENHLTDLLGFSVDVILKRSIRQKLQQAILKEAIPL